MNMAAWIVMTAFLALAMAVLIRAGIVYLLYRLRTVGERRLSERYGPGQVAFSDSGALFFGLSSRGLSQIRGTGVLVLTDNELWFSRYLLREELLIPLSRVHEVRLVGSHLRKKIIGRELLFVRFAPDGENDDSNEDSVAWLVAAPNTWKEEISRRFMRVARPVARGADDENDENDPEPTAVWPANTKLHG
jgi:hypothetical protein